MQYSVGEILPIIRPYAGNSGTCNQALQIRYLNLARSLLWNKVDQSTLCEYICIKCVHGTLTLPSLYKQIRLAWFDGVPVNIGNEWYQSIPPGNYGAGSGGDQGSYGFNDVDGPNILGRTSRFLEIGGDHVVFQNYTKAPYLLSVEAENNNDVGSEITFWGEDAYGTRKSEKIILDITPNKVLSKGYFQSVNKVTKARTNGRVRLYAYNPDLQEQLLLSIYQPYDVNPNYKKFAVKGCVKQNIILYCKKNYVELSNLDELVEFQPEALISAVMAVVYRENKGSDDLYAKALQNAIFEVNRETADNEEPVASVIRQGQNNMQLSPLIPSYEWDFGNRWPY